MGDLIPNQQVADEPGRATGPAEDPTVAVINESTLVSDQEVATAVPALQTQVDRDFSPVWHTGAVLSLVPRGSQPPPGQWWVVVTDDADQAGALGYHDLTSEGLPIAKVFARTSAGAGLPWTSVASHELLEMLADPDIDLTVFDQDGATTGTLYAYEVADPVEAQGYQIDGIAVSDFVTPRWFMPGVPGGAVDFMGAASSALEILPGGYVGVFDVTAGSGWQQRTNGEPLWWCSRRHRRRIPRRERRRSRRFSFT
jgi:hypothetical protein